MRKIVIIVMLCSISFLYADSESDGRYLAKELGLNAASKAIIQWERVFRSQRKMKRYKIDKLPKEKRILLKKYLITHAIDSDHPTVAGV